MSWSVPKLQQASGDSAFVGCSSLPGRTGTSVVQSLFATNWAHAYSGLSSRAKDAGDTAVPLKSSQASVERLANIFISLPSVLGPVPPVNWGELPELWLGVGATWNHLPTSSWAAPAYCPTLPPSALKKKNQSNLIQPSPGWALTPC